MKKLALLATCLVLTYLAVPQAQTGSYTTTKQTLSGANFKIKCAFYPPSHPKSTTTGRTLAGRVENGQFHLVSGNDYLMEWAPPPCVAGEFPTVTTFKDLGTPYGVYNGFAWQPVYSNVGDMKLTGVYFDQTTEPETVYAVSNTEYNNNSAESELNLVVAHRNTDGTITPYGMYRTSPANSFGTRMGSNMGTLPADFSQVIYKEKRMWFGCGGGYYQGIISNHISTGPALFAMSPQDGTAIHQGYIKGSFSPILWHVWNSAAYSIPRIARMPKDAPALDRVNASTAAIGHPVDGWIQQADGTAYWSTSDSNAACSWLDFPDLNLEGFVNLSTHFIGDAMGTIVSATPSADLKSTEVVITPTRGTMVRGMSVYTPSVDGPSYGGFEGFIAAINGNTITLNRADFQPFTYRPTIGGPLVAGDWYGPGGNKLPLSDIWLSVYSTTSLAQSALNTAGPWSELDPVNASRMDFGLKRYQNPTEGLTPMHATAIVRNPLNHDVYVNVDDADRGAAYNENRPMVYVLEVIGGTPTPIPPIPTPEPPVPTPPADTTSPTITLSAKRSGNSNNYSVVASAMDAVGVTKITISLDNSVRLICNNIAVCSGTLTIRTIGSHTALATAWDAAGNYARATQQVLR